eukprot:scaffold8828_cov129-Isochrysis_galbana.AAC.7
MGRGRRRDSGALPNGLVQAPRAAQLRHPGTGAVPRDPHYRACPSAGTHVAPIASSKTSFMSASGECDRCSRSRGQ